MAYLRAGNATAHGSIGNAYFNGDGVKEDAKKAKHHWELAAIGGKVIARYFLGIAESDAGNVGRAIKHPMIAAGAGCDESLQAIRQCFMKGHATKDDFEKALRAHKAANDETRSVQREEPLLL